jgi:hypothetical protein
MKEEMELVQNMENNDERDSDVYIDKLEDLLSVKSDAVGELRNKVKRFQEFRKLSETQRK